jgi:hypothetical protein
MFGPAKITHPVVVNDGKPFDAFTMELSFHINDLDLYITNYDDNKNGFIFHQSFSFNTLKELQDAKYSVQWQLAQALNPPIMVTDAVLEAINKVPEAKFWVWDDESKYTLERPCNTYVSLNDSWTNGRDFDDEGIPYHSKLQIGDYIQADCPLALQVLLGFTTEGVPKND